jgi:hypothetical protein
MSNNSKAQRQAKRQQEDAILNRILILFACAVVLEAVLLLLERAFPAVPLLRWLSYLVPSLAVLVMVYYLFQRDYFCITLICAGGILSLQLYRKLFWLHPTMLRCGYVLAFVLLAAAAALFLLLRYKDGFAPKLAAFLPRDTSYPLLYITCGLNAVVLALTLILGGTAPYYLLFVLVGWLFAMAVYYVVKLM